MRIKTTLPDIYYHMSSKIQNIYRYQLIRKCGLEGCLYLNESTEANSQEIDKAKNIASRAIVYFENNNNSEALQTFSDNSNKIWNSNTSFKLKVLKVCRLLNQLGVEPNDINIILGRERCDGVLYYIAYKNGKPKLFAHSLYRSGEPYGGSQSGSQSYGQAVLSGAEGSERATGFTITREGIEFIKKYEGGFQAKSYKDTTGRSIGYGHFITSSDPKWLQDKYYGGTITQEQAEEIMASDIQKIANAVAGQFSKRIRGPLSQASGYPQAFIDMIISIAYNAGAGGLAKSKLFGLLMTAPYDETNKMIDLDYLRNKVLPSFPSSCNKNNKGIINRRRAEAEYVAQRVFKA